jgi:hypothetical protein
LERAWLRIFGKEEEIPRRISAANPDDGICRVCSNLRGLTTLRNDIEDWSKLVQSAEAGCCTCALLVRGIDQCVPAIERDSSINVVVLKHPSQTLKLLVQSNSFARSTVKEEVEFFTLACEYRFPASFRMSQ